MQVASGPGFVVEMVNLAERTWRTGSGPAQTGPDAHARVVFGTGRDRLTDPRIIYDASSGRWLASISDLDTNSVLLAVSTSADPTAPWTLSSYLAPGCADQPRLGVADGIVVLAADIFRNCDESGSQAIGNEVWVVNKQELLGGATNARLHVVRSDAGISSFAPVQSLSATATDYAVSVDEPRRASSMCCAVDGIPPAAVTVTEVATPTIMRSLRRRRAAAADRLPGARSRRSRRTTTACSSRSGRTASSGSREHRAACRRATRSALVRARGRARDRDAAVTWDNDSRSRARTSSIRRSARTVPATS